MVKKLKTRVTPKGVQVLLWAIVTLVIIDALAKFNVFDLSRFVSPVLIPTVASLFILMEIGFMQFIRGKKKLDALSWLGLIIAGLGLISVVLVGLFALEIEFLITIQGVLSLALGAFAVIEIFR